MTEDQNVDQAAKLIEDAAKHNVSPVDLLVAVRKMITKAQRLSELGVTGPYTMSLKPGTDDTPQITLGETASPRT